MKGRREGMGWDGTGLDGTGLDGRGREGGGGGGGGGEGVRFCVQAIYQACNNQHEASGF